MQLTFGAGTSWGCRAPIAPIAHRQPGQPFRHAHTAAARPERGPGSGRIAARRPWIGMNGIVKSGTKDTGGSDEGRHLRQLAGQATTELAATSKPPVAGDRCSTNSLRSGDTTSGKRGRPKQAKSVGRSPRPIIKT